MRKRILSILMALCMALSLVPTAFAADDADSSTSESQPVYIYLDIINDNQKWFTTNDSKWITVGYVDVPGLEKANDASNGYIYKDTNGLQDQVLKCIQTDGKNDFNKLGSTWSKNEKYSRLLFSEVNWNTSLDSKTGYGLRQSYGADNYVPHEIITWHLDGVLDMSQYGLVVVNYYKQNPDGTYPKEPEQVETIKKVNTTISPNDYASKYDSDGYALKSA